MLTPETPPGFVVSEEAHNAAYENGFRVELDVRGGWIGYRSTTAQGEIWIARSTTVGQPWLLALTHTGVIAEILLPTVEASDAPSSVVFAFPTLSGLYNALDRAYKLGFSLPDAPLETFRKLTNSLPRSTEAERLTVVRVGQDIFRKALLEYWNGRCPLTGITEPALLRASHIVPWAECETDALRLDVHNGLLLSSLWDSAFDAGLVSFDDGGSVIHSPKLSQPTADALQIGKNNHLDGLKDAHRSNLARHRSKHGFTTGS